MPTYFIKKRVRAINIIDAIQKERDGHAETKDVWFEDEDGEEIEISGFEYCETNYNTMAKKTTPKKAYPKKPSMPMKPKKDMPMKKKAC